MNIIIFIIFFYFKKLSRATQIKTLFILQVIYISRGAIAFHIYTMPSTSVNSFANCAVIVKRKSCEIGKNNEHTPSNSAFCIDLKHHPGTNFKILQTSFFFLDLMCKVEQFVQKY